GSHEVRGEHGETGDAADLLDHAGGAHALAGGELPGAGQDGHAPCDVLDGDLDHAALLRGVEAVDLPAAAEDEHAVDAAVDGEVEDLAQAVLEQLAVLVQRRDEGGDDAVERGHGVSVGADRGGGGASPGQASVTRGVGMRLP